MKIAMDREFAVVMACENNKAESGKMKCFVAGKEYHSVINTVKVLTVGETNVVYRWDDEPPTTKHRAKIRHDERGQFFRTGRKSHFLGNIYLEIHADRARGEEWCPE